MPQRPFSRFWLPKMKINVVTYVIWYFEMWLCTYYRIQFLFRQPSLSYVENIFTLPFSRAVWIGSTGLLCFIAFLLYYTLKCETNIQEKESNERIKNITWSDMLLLTVGAVCQQGKLITHNIIFPNVKSQTTTLRILPRATCYFWL